jgi:hypothetical protein
MTIDIGLRVKLSRHASELPLPVLWRQPHDRELYLPGPSTRSPDRNYRGDALGSVRDTGGQTIPEPFRVYPDHQTPLDCGWQSLIRAINPEHKPDVTDKVLDHHWILANNTGIGEADRKNCRNGDNMSDPAAKWPALHTPIICGGATLSGTVDGELLRIESLLTGNPVPSAEYVLSRPWLWFWLTEINPAGVVTYMTLSAQDGTRKPVRMPLVSRLPLWLPLPWLHRVTGVADPLAFGG